MFDTLENNEGWDVSKAKFEGRTVKDRNGVEWWVAFCGAPVLYVDFDKHRLRVQTLLQLVQVEGDQTKLLGKEMTACNTGDTKFKKFGFPKGTMEGCWSDIRNGF